MARDDGLLTVEDATMLVSYAELDMDQSTFQRSCQKSRISSFHSITLSRPASPEHMMAESLVADIIQPHLSPQHQHQPNDLLSLEKWIAFIKSFVRLKHMQDLLVQRKGIMPPSMEYNTPSSNRHFPSASSISSNKIKRLSSQRSHSSNDILHNDETGFLASSVSGYPSILDDLSSVMVANPTDSATALRTHSQPSESLHSTTTTSSRLAPLKLKRQKRREQKAEFLQKSGFDSGFGRETPRCLRPGEESIDLSKENGKWEMIRELKRELQLSQEGLAQIDTAMAENITWVHNNCQVDDKLKNRALSQRAIRQCQKISLDRFFEIFDSIRLVALKRAFDKMKFAVKLTGIATLSKDYSRAKSIEILSHILSAALQRQYQIVFKPWLLRFKWERRWEQEAASVEIGRVIRGFNSRRRVYHMIREKNSVIIQCCIRVFLSKCRVYHRRMKKLIDHSLSILVRFFRGLVSVSKAKAIVQDKRERRAAIKIQSLQRGIMARQRVQAIRARQQLMQQSAIVIQCLYRSKVRAYYRVKRRREELEKEKQRLYLLEIENQKKREKAILCLQCFGRKIIACHRVAEKRRERLRHVMACKIQRMVRRILETQSYKQQLKVLKRQRRKEEKLAHAEIHEGSQPPQSAASSRPSSASSTATSVIHTAAVKLQSLYRGAVARETVKAKREEKKKNAPRLFNRTISEPPQPSQPHHSTSQSFFGFGKSKSTAAVEPERPKSSSTPSPVSHTSFFGGLMRSASKDRSDPAPQHSSRSAEEEITPPKTPDKDLQTPAREGAFHRMLSIVRSNSREDVESPIASPVKTHPTHQEEMPESEPTFEPEGGAPPVPVVEVESEDTPENPHFVDDETHHHPEDHRADEEVQLINSPYSDPPETTAITHERETPNIPPTNESKSPSRDTSVLTPLTSIGKKLFRTNSEMSPASPGLTSKSPSFFRSLSRPLSRADSSTPDEQKKGMLAKSPSLFRSLSQSIFGDKQNKSNSGTPTLGRSLSRLFTPKSPVERSSEDTAAATIQRAARRRQARRRVQQRRDGIQEIQRQAGEWVLWSAITLQRIVRGKLSRQRIKRIKKEREDMKKKEEREHRERKKAEREAKIHEEDEAEIQNILKYKAYGKGEKTPKKEKEIVAEKPIEEEKKEKEKKKKKKVKSESRPTTAAAAEEKADGGGDEMSILTNDQSPSLAQNEESSIAMTDQLKRLEELEKSMKEKEQRMLEATRQAEEKAAAIERALEMMEKRAKEEEFERIQRKKFLDMAAGSPYSSIGPRNSARPFPSSRMGSARPPPSARSARDGTPRPKEAIKVVVHGVEWVQLWDPAENAWYWYCEASGAAQWEQPTEYYPPMTAGYESGGGMTDYSTDNYESGAESYQGDGTTYGPWQEFWDESAQAKYWYNNETGEASWTIPEEYATGMDATSSSSVAGMGEWVSYIDENTGQEYWYNATTGETSWG